MRVAVIGGGIAGLSAAHELLRRGADPVLFEACARAGGKVGTRNERGYLSEDGPNFLARPLDALLDASGLRPEVVTPRPPMTRWIHLDGRVLRAPGRRVRLGARVGQLSPAQGGWSVQGERFEGVVLAVPAAAAADLTHKFAPKFADAARRFHSAPVTVVHLGLRRGGLPRGFGMIDADGTLHGVGTLLPSSMLPGRAPEGRALVTAICGGARHPEPAAPADGALVGALMAGLRAPRGGPAAPEYLRVVRWEAAIPQYAPGHRERVREARELVADLPRLELAGAAWDGVGVPDVARSGAEAAARLVQ